MDYLFCGVFDLERNLITAVQRAQTCETDFKALFGAKDGNCPYLRQKNAKGMGEERPFSILGFNSY